MNDTKQPVEASGLLAKLGELFFKGLDGLLSGAAEYEEEYGVLKEKHTQVIKDKEGNEYTLVIKLSPVKDKEGLFYVEASTDCPGFDVSSIDKKTMKIDKSNIESFNQMIADLIAKNNLEVIDSESSKEDNASESNEEELLDEAEDKAQDLKQSFDSSDFTAEDEDGNEIHIVLDYAIEGDELQVTVHAQDNNGNDIDKYEAEEYEDTCIENGKVVSFNKFKSAVKNAANEFIKNNNLKATDERLTASTHLLEATFIRSAETGDVELTAIKASCDISDAMDVVYAIVDDDSFTDCLTEEPQSFAVIETDEDYDVESIDSVDTSFTYRLLFDSVSKVLSVMQTIAQIVDIYTTLPNIESLFYMITNDIQPTIGKWLYAKTKDYPICCCCITQDELKSAVENEDGSLNLESVVSLVAELSNDFATLLDNLYVNLDHVEQSRADSILNNLRDRLAPLGYNCK